MPHFRTTRQASPEPRFAALKLFGETVAFVNSLRSGKSGEYPEMAGIFITYRREDSAAYAGRLHDQLVARFGRDRVFMDIDAIEPGDDYTQVIAKRVGSA